MLRYWSGVWPPRFSGAWDDGTRPATSIALGSLLSIAGAYTKILIFMVQEIVPKRGKNKVETDSVFFGRLFERV